jgi:hypothetical protein
MEGRKEGGREGERKGDGEGGKEERKEKPTFADKKINKISQIVFDSDSQIINYKKKENTGKMK